MNNASEPTADSLATWMFVSQLQYWVVLCVVMMTLPLLITGLFRLRRLRRSPYYHFLVGICAANLVSLSTILFDLLAPSVFPFMKGNVTCKVTPFLINIAACFANWTIVMMFAQRFAVLLFPLKQMAKDGCFGLFLDSRRLLAVVLLFSIATQSWALLFMTERLYLDESGKLMVTCQTDPTKIDPTTATWMSIMEMSSTYLLPFICTLFVDLGVLIWSKQHCSTKQNEPSVKRGMIVTSMGQAASNLVLFRGISFESKTLSKSSSIDQESGVKIQSAESVKESIRKQRNAIKRCLMMATVQVLINLPYHTLQVFDEVYDFANDQDWFTAYFYADALLYLIYLLQYPAVLLHIEFLISDMSNKGRKSPLIISNGKTMFKMPSQDSQKTILCL